MKSKVWFLKTSLERVEYSGASDDIGTGALLFLEYEVGLADGIGLRVYFLAIEMAGYAGPFLTGHVVEGFLCNGQHAASPQGAVVKQVGGGLELVSDGGEYQLGHQLDRVSGRPVFAGLLVIFLVEPADEVLKDGSHGVVVQPGQLFCPVVVEDRLGAEIHAWRQESLYERVESTVGGEPSDLVAELELVQDVLDIGGEAVQVP